MHARQVAKPANPVAHMTEVRLSILMGSVNIFAQQEDIVGREKHTKLVMTVLAVELQVNFDFYVLSKSYII